MYAPQEIRMDRIFDNLVVDLDITGLDFNPLRRVYKQAECDHSTEDNSSHFNPRSTVDTHLHQLIFTARINSFLKIGPWMWRWNEDD
jgi:hypothetical protein